MRTLDSNRICRVPVVPPRVAPGSPGSKNYIHYFKENGNKFEAIFKGMPGQWFSVSAPALMGNTQDFWPKTPKALLHVPLYASLLPPSSIFLPVTGRSVI